MALDSPYTLNAVRTLKNYGLYIIGNTYDPIFSKGILQSKPNVLINGSTCTIDYSHVFDTSDRTYLKKTFGTLSSGETFTFSSTDYFDETQNIVSNLSGTLLLSSTGNDNQLIFATILSGMTAITGYNYYSKDNFVSIPQYTFTATGGTVGCFLINSLPNSSPLTFKEMGLIGSAFGFEEYIDISGGTNSNNDKIQIYASTTLKDNTEIVYFTSGATAQDFSTTATTVNFYLRGYPTLITSPNVSNVTGIFTINGATTGDLIYCFENQSLNQAVLRTSKLGSTYAGNYSECESCYDLIYGSGIFTPFNNVLPSFSNLVYLIVYSQSNASAVSAGAGSFVVTNTTNISLIPTPNNNLKIDLSHPSMLGYDLSIYYDSGHTIPVGSNYFEFGTPGYNGSFGFLQNYETTSTLYCVLSGLSTIYFTITT